ncbi:unnamed protein product [Meloidogyne enterolobii]|uniref:Uncharacterized protein n=1 Tax=Meloidogyne enterolobii TaxID=390850 RepID=A0ACB1ALT0_MELEN
MLGYIEAVIELSGLPNFSEKQSEQDFQNEEKGPLGQRKRRRLIGNLDNTLDGLVAKRADLPLKKRYQSETEAIELPDDEQEMKRMETDPDVCTRMCSVCGYQGKWVSEMIRHKRVHTNDRPFKCKYCNRTSKWKADLIRHVASKILIGSRVCSLRGFCELKISVEKLSQEDCPQVEVHRKKSARKIRN